MSFRKRNVAINQGAAASAAAARPQTLPGVRPSPVTSNPTTSTGTASLDKLLALGAGLALGTSLLIEEDGTTDFAGSLLRCAAAEALCQGHKVFVVALDGWAQNLPGFFEEKGPARPKEQGVDPEKMKIAWRYERLGIHGEGTRASSARPADQQPASPQPFCHTFDLSKRMAPLPDSLPVTHLKPSQDSNPSISPFSSILANLHTHLQSSFTAPTRVIIPSLLNPLLYPQHSSSPGHFTSFLHTLRAVLRTFPTFTVLISWPLALYPRTHVLTRLAETLCDGVISLHPFPHAFSADAPATDRKTDADDEKMQGLLRVAKLPVLSERGVAVGGGVGDMAFAVGRRRMLIRPFYLPPVEGEEEGREEKDGEKGKELEF